MSLLTFFSLSRLNATRRPCLAALRKNMSREAGMEFFDSLSAPSDFPPSPQPDIDQNDTSRPQATSSTLPAMLEADDSVPPIGPEGGYPPPSHAPPNARTILQARPIYRVYVQSTRNNTIATVSRPDGNPIKIITGGTCGFKKSNRAGYEAGYQCATTTFGVLKTEQEKGIDLSWELFLNGYGQGREAVQRALMAAEGMEVRDSLVRVTDRTPIKIGGTRAPKTRRL